MKKSHASHRGSFLLLFAILCSVCVQRAHADETPVDLFTGTFTVLFGGQIAFAADDHVFQNFNDVTVLFGSGFAGALTTNPGISSYSNDHGCDNNASPCSEHWSGTFNGGSVSLTGGDANGHLISFVGTITGGSFSGNFSSGNVGTFGSNAQTFNFISTWTNGWTSEGTFTADSCFGDCSPYGSSGTLSMTTMAATPEPGSMILMGSGMFLVGVLCRRMSSMQKHWPS